MNVVYRPARSSVALALVPGVVAALALAVNAAGVVLGLSGLVVVGLGAARGSRRVVTLGGLVAYSGVVVAGIAGARPGLLLVAAAGTVVTWTTAQHVVGLGRQLGRDAHVARSVVVHLASTTIATLVAGGTALAVFRLVGNRLPFAAVVFLLAGVALLLVVLEL